MIDSASTRAAAIVYLALHNRADRDQPLNPSEAEFTQLLRECVEGYKADTSGQPSTIKYIARWLAGVPISYINFPLDSFQQTELCVWCRNAECSDAERNYFTENFQTIMAAQILLCNANKSCRKQGAAMLGMTPLISPVLPLFDL